MTSDGLFIARVNGEPVYRAFENVIRNAVRYSAPGTVVEVQAVTKAADGTFRVEVRDRRPGVPGDKLAMMFEPFVRLEGNAATRCTGLGLAIARRAIVSHRGSIEAMPREGGGLVMRIELPSTGARAVPPD